MFCFDIYVIRLIIMQNVNLMQAKSMCPDDRCQSCVDVAHMWCKLEYSYSCCAAILNLNPTCTSETFLRNLCPGTSVWGVCVVRHPPGVRGYGQTYKISDFIGKSRIPGCVKDASVFMPIVLTVSYLQ